MCVCLCVALRELSAGMQPLSSAAHTFFSPPGWRLGLSEGKVEGGMGGKGGRKRREGKEGGKRGRSGNVPASRGGGEGVVVLVSMGQRSQKEKTRGGFETEGNHGRC